MDAKKIMNNHLTMDAKKIMNLKSVSFFGQIHPIMIV